MKSSQHVANRRDRLFLWCRQQQRCCIIKITWLLKLLQNLWRKWLLLYAFIVTTVPWASKAARRHLIMMYVCIFYRIKIQWPLLYLLFAIWKLTQPLTVFSFNLSFDLENTAVMKWSNYDVLYMLAQYDMKRIN